MVQRGFPGTSDGKQCACNAGDPNSIPGLGRSPAEGIGYPLQYSCGLVGEESTRKVGDLDLIPGLERSPGERHGKPLQYSSLENPLGQRSLAGYSPWGPKELDTTE